MEDGRAIFLEKKESIVGYITLNTGTLLLTDGVWVDNIKVSQEEKLAIDLGTDRIKIPVIATKQNNRRFLLIPLDAAVQQNVSEDLTADIDEEEGDND